MALVVAYNGRAFHGWQFQNEQTPTVQLALQQALGIIADHPMTVHCAGRTDTGVHATRQIVHFDAPVARPEKAWVMGTNTHLPDDISVEWAAPVSPDFDARRSATARRYLYLLHNHPIRSALMSDYVTSHKAPLDADEMHAGARYLLGEQDFSSFRAAHCQARTPMRNVHSVTVSRTGDMVVVDIEANAFLQHMVRNIVGVLLDIGVGQRPAGWVGELLSLRDRTRASRTAPPNGLYLIDVIYPPSAGIPPGPNLPHLLAGAMPLG